MKKYIVGINEGINSSVVFYRNGSVDFALQEERINKEKEFVGFPAEALHFGMEYLSIGPENIEKVILSNETSPLFTKQQFLEAYEKLSPQGKKSGSNFLSKVLKFTSNVSQKKQIIQTTEPTFNLSSADKILTELGFKPEKIVRKNHHFNHAACAYFGRRKNSTEPHLIFTLDGGGDGDCAHVYIANENSLKLISSSTDENSLGNMYSRVTYYMGMTPHEHEYKIMGLAAYCPEKYSRKIAEKFHSYLGLDPKDTLKFKRKIKEPISQILPRLERDMRRTRFDNLSGGLQLFTEELLENWITETIKKTGVTNVVASGGVFMNVKANQRIAQIKDITFFDVFPSCGDETLPFGAIWSEANPNNGFPEPELKNFYLGPQGSFGLEKILKKVPKNISVERLENVNDKVAELLAEGKIIARCSGRMEFGARALGNRSILADPQNFEVVAKINKMIKQRDFWMPFAPLMTQKFAKHSLQISKALPIKDISPFMMHTFNTQIDYRKYFKAGIHPYDNSTRAQIVTNSINPDIFEILSIFGKRTGYEVLLNTSFNLHGYPIVLGAEDALNVLINSGLEQLVIDEFIFTKS